MAKKRCATKLLLFLAAILLLTYLMLYDDFYVLRLLQNGDNPDGNSSSTKRSTNNNHNNVNNKVNSTNNYDDNTRGDKNHIYHDYLTVTEFTYIDAYNECCRHEHSSSSSTAGSLNCTEQDDEWFTRLINKREIIQSGDGTLYWAHMRKAGGTSFSHALESHAFNTTHEPDALFTQGFTHTVKLHLQAGSLDCINHTYANETLFITIFRHPVDRYVSEYFYRGIDKNLESTTAKDSVLEWHNLSKNTGGEGVVMRKAAGHFIENWQTRWYTNPNHCVDLDRPLRDDHGHHYSYWKSGQKMDPRITVTESDLIEAKRVLDKFDVVGVAPFFGGECSIVPWLQLAGSNKPLMEINEVKKQHKSNVLAERRREELKQAIWDNLGEEVKFDVELYEYVRETSKRRSAISCCVVEHAMEL